MTNQVKKSNANEDTEFWDKYHRLVSSAAEAIEYFDEDELEAHADSVRAQQNCTDVVGA